MMDWNTPAVILTVFSVLSNGFLLKTTAHNCINSYDELLKTSKFVFTSEIVDFDSASRVVRLRVGELIKWEPPTERRAEGSADSISVLVGEDVLHCEKKFRSGEMRIVFATNGNHTQNINLDYLGLVRAPELQSWLLQFLQSMISPGESNVIPSNYQIPMSNKVVEEHGFLCNEYRSVFACNNGMHPDGQHSPTDNKSIQPASQPKSSYVSLTM